MKDAILRTLNSMTNAGSLEELWSQHVIKMEEYGFDRLLYGYTNFRVDLNLGDPEDFVILSNQERAYLDRFFGERMFLNGPMIQWALENDGACSWQLLHDQVVAGNMPEEQRQVLEFNREFQVNAGYTISFKSVSLRSKGAIGLVAKPSLSQQDVEGIWAEHGDDILLLNNVLHLKILNLPYSNPKRALTKRQREVLEWVSDGKTIQDIATLLSRTPATVEKHLRLARESLGVETTPQAVAKASLLNQMFTIES